MSDQRSKNAGAPQSRDDGDAEASTEKVSQTLKAGGARFEQERQALAVMNHLNVARRDAWSHVARMIGEFRNE